MLADRICCAVRKIPYDIKDFAVPFWGLAAAMLMPSSVSAVIILLAAVICIVLGKHIFGSSDNIMFSPPAIAAAFLVVCYPAEMLYFPKAGEHYPLFGEFEGTLARSLEYTLKLGNVPTDTAMDILMGNVPGAIGTVNILIIAVCGICLLVRGTNSLAAVLPCLGVVSLLAFFYPRTSEGGWLSVLYELSSGSLLFGVTFMSAEPYLFPKRPAAKVMYGLVLGYTVMMFRYFGQTEGSFVFALLITGALSCCFDTIVENVLYWKTNYISSFERSRTQVQHGNVKLTDTQEIQLPPKYRYNTPPINGEVKRKSRRKTADKADKPKEDKK
jgi:electron transport complex protein RnfD